jgi:ribose transport system permease protein
VTAAPEAETPAEPPVEPPAVIRRRRVRRFVESGGTVWVMVALLAAFAAISSDDFRSLGNVSNISRQGAVLALVALAQFLVVLTAGIDLSIGAVAKLTAIVSAITMAGSNLRLVPGILVAVGIGALVGAINGYGVTRLRVPAFVMTLGMLAVVQGVALYVAPTPRGRSSPFLGAFFGWSIGPFFGVVLLVMAVWVVAWWALYRRRWGRHVYAFGGNPEVARVSGVPINRIQFSAYLVSGALAGLAGLLITARSGVGDPNAGLGLEFESLAAVVVGGASLFGGRGRLIGVLGGVVLLAMLGNIFNLVGIQVWYQQLLKGVIILAAAAIYLKPTGATR